MFCDSLLNLSILIPSHSDDVWLFPEPQKGLFKGVKPKGYKIDNALFKGIFQGNCVSRANESYWPKPKIYPRQKLKLKIFCTTHSTISFMT